MKRLPFPAATLAICAALFALVALACSGGGSEGSPSPLGGLTPIEAVVQSGQGLTFVDSYRVHYSFTMGSSIEGEEGYQSQALVFSQVVASGPENAEYLLIPPDLYVREGDEGWLVLSPWHQGIRPEELSAITDDDALGADDAFLDYANLTKAVEGAEQLPDEDIDGEAAVRIAGTVDISAVWAGAPSEDVDAQFWLHRGNSLPLRFELGPIRSLPEETLMILEFSGYNEPVIAPERPRDAQPVRDVQLVDAPCTGADLAACLPAQSELAAGASASCDGTGRRVCIVPLGQVSVGLVQHLADYYGREYGLTVTVLAPLAVPDALINPQRGQADGNDLIEYIESAYRTDDDEAVLIGVTPIDVYDRQSHVRYYLSMRWDYFYPTAVVSSFRMNPLIYGEPADVDLFYSRVRKMLTKYLGVLYYDLPLSSNPTSPMFDSIGGPGDLDYMQEPLALPPATE